MRDDQITSDHIMISKKSKKKRKIKTERNKTNEDKEKT